MCCWSIRVLWTVVQNLFSRVTEECVDSLHNGCCCSRFKRKQRPLQSSLEEINDSNKNCDDYLVISVQETPVRKLKTIESEPYFRALDRAMAEDILDKRIDGSCLVRPYREEDKIIKYILSIFAKNNFFHLYIRKQEHKFRIGLEKPCEKLFDTPSDIINYYKINKLLCMNKSISVNLYLIPIT